MSHDHDIFGALSSVSGPSCDVDRHLMSPISKYIYTSDVIHG